MNKMKAIVGLLIAIGILIAPAAYCYKKVKCFMPQVPPINLKGMKQVAVLDFQGTDAGSRSAGSALSQMITDFLLKEGRGITSIEGGLFGSDREGTTLIDGFGTKIFTVVERSRLQAVLAEQSIGESGLVDDAQAAKIGKLLGVHVLISGTVSAEKTESKANEVHATYRDKQKVEYVTLCLTREIQVIANYRIVNATTGEILASKQSSRKVTDKKCEDDSKGIRDEGEMSGVCVAGIAWEITNMINPWYQLEEFELDKVKAKEFEKEADEAAKAAEKLELAKAYAVYNKLYESDSYNPQYLYNMGILYEITGDFEHAKEMYDGAASLKDEKDYKESQRRATARAALVPFYASFGMGAKKYDFVGAASDPSLLAKKITVRGGSSDRIEVLEKPDPTLTPVAKVPGEVQLEVLGQEGDWYLVKLMGGKQGYINKEKVK